MVGVFNCQGAGWCKVAKKTRIHDTSPGTLTGSVQVDDVDAFGQVAGSNWDGDTVVYAYRSGTLAVSITTWFKLFVYESLMITGLCLCEC